MRVRTQWASLGSRGDLAAAAALTFFAALTPVPAAPAADAIATTAEDAGLDGDSFTDEERSWWAVQPVRDPAPPAAAGAGWARNAIDRFVALRLSAAGLGPAPDADRRELVRRLYFDLHGLPPTPDQVQAFLGDTRPDAWERLIDELLESPRYGERWGQHWLDVVRWAESDGYRQDAFRPHAWPYRDYVVGSFNADKPYDRFVREQLAGDEIDPDDPDVLIGTAYLRNGLYEYNQRDVRFHWGLIVDELTDLTGEVFLGVGIGCARCHDHKFDPLLQKDYYRLQAFLAPVRWRFDLPLASPEKRARHAEQRAAWEAATAEIRAGIDAILEPAVAKKQKEALIKFPEEIQAFYALAPEERTPLQQQLVELTDIQIRYERERFDEKKEIKGERAAELQRLRDRLAQFDHLKPKPLPVAFVASDVGQRAPLVAMGKRRPRPVEPGFLSLLDPGPAEVPPAPARPGASTGRRLALAEWIVRPDNPLSTRVIVNRIWQHHFGRGIVATPNDFGSLGGTPSHPELLDWLTSRFLEEGWRFKPLHRLILNSATYRQTARREPPERARIGDGANRLLWRFPPRRLDAEQLRDAILAASGELDPTPGGPSVKGTSPRRSLYVRRVRNTPDEVLKTFDAPPGFGSAPERDATTTAHQSLLLINGEWAVARAGAFARRLLKGRGADPGDAISAGLVSDAYRIAYGRPPAEEELAAALAFLRQQAKHAPAPAPPAHRFPNENGLRPISQAFNAANGVELGAQALWLQPGSRFERLHLRDLRPPRTAGAGDVGEPVGDVFTLEAVATLDALYPSADVRTLAARWDGDKATPGWTFGVTSEKSRYDPRNLIVQLVGEDFQGNTVYEVVASDLRVPLGRPVYLAAAISAHPARPGGTAGTVTFFLKDLAAAGAPMQTRTVEHPVVGGIQSTGVRLTLGGRDQGGRSLWDGQLARFALTAGRALGGGDLVITAGGGAGGGEPLLDWAFAPGAEGEHPAPGTAWLRAAKPAPAGPDPLVAAVSDFCHALLSSNEFLYLH